MEVFALICLKVYLWHVIVTKWINVAPLSDMLCASVFKMWYLRSCLLWLWNMNPISPSGLVSMMLSQWTLWCFLVAFMHVYFLLTNLMLHIMIGNVLSLKNSLNLSPDIPEVSQEKLLSLIAERLIDSNINFDVIAFCGVYSCFLVLIWFGLFKSGREYSFDHNRIF